MINTRFWSDNFVVAKQPLTRYLFLYLLTNEHTNISGVYELPLRTMSYETNLKENMLIKCLEELYGKVYYLDGWVYIKNFQKHQSTSSETVQRGISSEMSKIPLEIKKKMEEIDKNIEGMDRVSGGTIYLNLNSNLNPNPNLNLNLNPTGYTPSQEAKNFFSMVSEGGAPFLDFIIGFEKVLGLPPQNGPARDALSFEIKKFCSYWCEKNKSGSKQRWELEKTFEVKRRLAFWFRNKQQWSNERSLKNKGKQIV